MAIDVRRDGPEQGVTPEQLKAITEAMRLIAEEDRERGVDGQSEFVCAACEQPRKLPGSVAYDGIRLCNSCATDYEVARISHAVQDCGQFVQSRKLRRH